MLLWITEELVKLRSAGIFASSIAGCLPAEAEAALARRRLGAGGEAGATCYIDLNHAENSKHYNIEGRTLEFASAEGAEYLSEGQRSGKRLSTDVRKP